MGKNIYITTKEFKNHKWLIHEYFQEESISIKSCNDNAVLRIHATINMVMIAQLKTIKNILTIFFICLNRSKVLFSDKAPFTKKNIGTQQLSKDFVK
jgi:hypothetical protein